MITKTLTEFTRAVEYGANVRGAVGAGTTYRHPTDDVNAEINSSYAEYRELLVERGFDFFLTEGSQTALPSTRADTNENYSLIDWPATAELIKRVDVYKSGHWEALEEIDWSALRVAIGSSGTTTSERPRFFSPKSFGTVSGSTETAGKIALAPFATGGVYKLSYMTHWVDITTGANKFIFPTETGYRWSVWNCVAKLLIRDEDPQSLYSKTVNERERCEQRIGRFSPRTVSTGGGQMRRKANYLG